MMPKPTEPDLARVRQTVRPAPSVEVKPMFGQLGAFVAGKMFAGCFGSSIGVKLAPEDLAEIRTIEGSGPFGPPERPWWATSRCR